MKIEEIRARYPYKNCSFRYEEDINYLLSYISTLEEKIIQKNQEIMVWVDTTQQFQVQNYVLEEKVKELEGQLSQERKDKNSWLETYQQRVREAESHLKKTEQEREHLSKELIEERMKIVELHDAIGKHEAFKRSHEKIVSLEDEELYQTRKEV